MEPIGIALCAAYAIANANVDYPHTVLCSPGGLRRTEFTTRLGGTQQRWGESGPHTWSSGIAKVSPGLVTPISGCQRTMAGGVLKLAARHARCLLVASTRAVSAKERFD